MLKQAVVLVGAFDGRSDTPGRRAAKAQPSILNRESRPFLDALIGEIARYDAFEEILLLGDYGADRALADHAGTVRGRSNLAVVLEKQATGTAGALARAADRLQERFLLLNGTSFFDFNFLDLTQRAGSNLAHLALSTQIAGGRFGRVILDNDRIHAFTAPCHGTTGPVGTGVGVIDRSVIDGIRHFPASLEQDVLPALASTGVLHGTCYDGYFVDLALADDPASTMAGLKGRLRRPAVFFDRDGVLNHDSGYIFEPSKLEWIDGAREAVKAVNDAGYLAFVVSNQSGVARGLYEESDVRKLHRWMAEEMAVMGAHIDAFEYCPDHPEGTIERYRRLSGRRKPAPGMITDLLGRFPVDADDSILIGDRASDLEAAQAAGLKGYLFSGGNLEAFVKQHLQPRSGRY